MPTSRKIVNFAFAPENGVDSAAVGCNPDSGLRNLIVRRKNRYPSPRISRQAVDAKGCAKSLSTPRDRFAQMRGRLSDFAMTVDRARCVCFIARFYHRGVPGNRWICVCGMVRAFRIT
jgi:hypothetical protein